MPDPLTQPAGGPLAATLRLKRARNPDAVCMHVLDRFTERMHAANIVVLLCGVRADFTKVLRSSRLLDRLGEDRLFGFEDTGMFWTSTLDAVRYAYELIGEDVCEHCPRHAESLNRKDGWYYLI